MQSTRYLRTVSKDIAESLSFDLILVLSNLYCWAVEYHCLDLRSLHLVVQELRQQWAKVCNYIEATSQRQEFQNVKAMLVDIGCKLFWKIQVK